MSGFGASFGWGPYGGTTPPEPTEPVTKAISCRLIDGVRRDYVTEDDGNPAAQDGTANRVYLLLSYNDVRQELITADGLHARADAIRRALEPLTRGPAPAIARLKVELVDAGGDRVEGTVSYWNNLTQQAESVTLP